MAQTAKTLKARFEDRASRLHQKDPIENKSIVAKLKRKLRKMDQA